MQKPSQRLLAWIANLFSARGRLLDHRVSEYNRLNNLD
jgi:hypothetical protein